MPPQILTDEVSGVEGMKQIPMCLTPGNMNSAKMVATEYFNCALSDEKCTVSI